MRKAQCLVAIRERRTNRRTQFGPVRSFGRVEFPAMRNLRKKAESLIHHLAPELGRTYVVLPRDLPETFAVAERHLIGLTMPGLELVVQTRLETLGLWRGHVPAILVNPTECTLRDQPAASRRVRRTHFLTEFFGACVHELAHLFEDGETVIEPITTNRVASHNALRKMMSGQVELNSGPRAEIPFHGHEHRFIRTVLHLAYRATRAGTQLFSCDVFSGGTYALSSAWSYAAALGDEPERLSYMPISAVLETRPPSAFVDLWRDDVLRWLHMVPAHQAEEVGTLLAKRRGEIFFDAVERTSDHDR